MDSLEGLRVKIINSFVIDNGKEGLVFKDNYGTLQVILDGEDFFKTFSRSEIEEI